MCGTHANTTIQLPVFRSFYAELNPTLTLGTTAGLRDIGGVGLGIEVLD